MAAAGLRRTANRPPATPYNRAPRPGSIRALPSPAEVLRVFDKLSARLASVVEGLRGRGRLTEENISDTLRQVRMALLEADVALPVVKTLHRRRQGAGRRPGDPQEPHAGPGADQDHPRRTRARDGRGRAAAQPARAAAGHHPAGRPAGRRQDDHRGQARAVAQDPREEARAAGLHRRAPPGGAAAARAAGAAARGRRRAGEPGRDAAQDRARRARRRRGAASTTCCSSTPRAACTSTTR